MEKENLVTFKKKNHEYILLAFLVIIGMVFLVSGKVKSTIFDKQAKKLTIRKRSITCHCRSITNYALEDLKGLRAVKRGIKQGQVETLHYAIILEFNQKQNQIEDDDSGSDVDKFNVRITKKVQRRIDI